MWRWNGQLACLDERPHATAKTLFRPPTVWSSCVPRPRDRRPHCATTPLMKGVREPLKSSSPAPLLASRPPPSCPPSSVPPHRRSPPATYAKYTVRRDRTKVLFADIHHDRHGGNSPTLHFRVSTREYAPR